jgi:hypothetical protein
MATKGEAGASSELERDETEETGKVELKDWQELERLICMASVQVKENEIMTQKNGRKGMLASIYSMRVVNEGTRLMHAPHDQNQSSSALFG